MKTTPFRQTNHLKTTFSPWKQCGLNIRLAKCLKLQHRLMTFTNYRIDYAMCPEVLDGMR